MNITNESKSNLSITNESKTGASVTIDEMDIAIDDATSTIDYPGLAIVKESKNNLTITNEAKN